MDNEYEAKQDRSLTQESINLIASTMQGLKVLSDKVRGTVVVSDEDGIPIAEVWWDEGSELWLADMIPHPPEETL